VADARSYGTVFDEVAVEYDRHRWTYPEELVDHACQVAGLRRGDPVLEVGCGSGQLTRSLLARGLRVTAVEPGEHLISLAEQSLDEVELVHARFEDAPLPDRRFRAGFSASAFHWTDPEVSWEKVARALAPGGTFALIQYCGLREERTAADAEAFLSALRSIAPEIAAEWPPLMDLETMLTGVQERRENVSEVWAWLGHYDVARSYAGHLFCDVEIATVPVGVEQSAEELGALLRTMSMYQRISPDQRQALERENVALLKRLGRPLRSSTVAVLVTARRTAAVTSL
jgi:SAM-dependent methyltransferase